jgi:hypothetical protein
MMFWCALNVFFSHSHIGVMRHTWVTLVPLSSMWWSGPLGLRFLNGLISFVDFRSNSINKHELWYKKLNFLRFFPCLSSNFFNLSFLGFYKMANSGILVQSSDSILVDNWVHPQFLGATSKYSTFNNLGGAYTKVGRNPKDWDILPFPPFKGL